MSDPTTRFSDRVADYVAGRPGYPDALLDAAPLPDGSVVVDLGSGTGLLSRVFLDAGHTVIGVEPNAAMAAAAPAHPRFRDVRATAEATGLPDASASLVAAGQAFHWFDPRAAAAECRRILKPGGRALLAWNLRDADADAFGRAYEALLVTHGTDYLTVSADKAATRNLAAFFGQAPAATALPNTQVLDWPGLVARVRSCSYVPNRDAPGYPAMMADLRALFDDHAQGGLVTLRYTVSVFVGRPAAG